MSEENNDWIYNLEDFYFEHFYDGCDCVTEWKKEGPLFDPQCLKCHEGIIIDDSFNFEDEVKKRGGLAIDIGDDAYFGGKNPLEIIINAVNNRTATFGHLCIDEQFIRYLVIYPYVESSESKLKEQK